MIVITTAMDKEYDLIEKRLEAPHIEEGRLIGVLKDKEVLLFKSGIGKVNATFGLVSLLHSLDNVERVISVGCAGAAVADLSVGDIVVGNSYCYHDVYCGEPNANGQVQGMPAVETREKVEAIKNFLPISYNICAIDMESAALAQVCYKKSIPFVSIRAISDNPLLPKSQKQQYKQFWRYIADAAFVALLKML